jgi:TetR/AcrR family transcriptional regulator, cholesterol catabolism regulator
MTTEVKDRILEKTHELFHRYGIKRVTMDDIASQCGISKKTIYQYYKDKNELVDAVTEDHISTNKKQCELDRQIAENALHEVFLAMDMVNVMFETLNPGLLHDLEKYHPQSFEKVKKHKYQFLNQVIKENLLKGISEGIYRQELNVEIMCKFRLESMFLPFNLELFPESRYNIAKIEQELMEHFVYGLATLKGQKLIEKYKKQRQNK